MFYPDEVIEEVRERNDIVDVISNYVKLKKSGSNYVGLCPFHNEKTPSFSVSRNKQMYYCFGCGAGGNVFTFIMEYENFSFAESVKYLAQRSGIDLPDEDYSGEIKRENDLKSRLYEVYKAAANYYYYQMKTEQGRKAYEYLKNRELTDETMKQFGLGYSNIYSDDLYRYLKSKGYEDELLNKSGLLTYDEKRGVHDKFWNRVMFPILDVHNKVIAFGGRVMGDGLPKYLNSPETIIFDKSRNLFGLNFARQARTRKFLLCEGYMDVIALYQAGFQNAVASLGTAFTSQQASLIKRYADEVFITYDSDQAGTNAALRAIPILKEAGLSVKVVNMRPHKDPDEFIKALGKEEYQKRMDQAMNSFLFEVDVLERQFNFEDPEQKTKFFQETAKKLCTFEDEIERSNYIEATARKYHIPYEDLKTMVNRYGASLSNVNQYNTAVKADRESSKPHKEADGIKQSQKILLTWLIEEPEIYDKIKDIITADDFKDEMYHKTAQLVFEQFRENGIVVPAAILNQFSSKEEQNEIAALFNTGLVGEINHAEKEKAFNDTIHKVKKFSLDYESSRVTSIEELQKIIKEQTNLQKLHISLQDG
ncbi:DNA primase [[Clostridium] polysaccharolyticum]|uniref:DNA primase n=1 Tax=[Clostridium] polysaccharolyticum TaxID=29364 RepID=A0A1I0D047_9FIRM|nr:DNA primase [[Clostridium] polysaccharolyticum]SET25511.1 DNA primase [[Clostridium] polysaccharolyticum]